MAIPCPCDDTIGTNVSIDNEPFVSYPCGTDIEVISIALTYSFVYGYNHYANVPPRYYQCGQYYVGFLYKSKNGAIANKGYEGSATPLGTSHLLSTEGEQWIYDNCMPLAQGETGFTVINRGHRQNICNSSYRYMDTFYNGSFLFTGDPISSTPFTVQIQAYQLKITTP